MAVGIKVDMAGRSEGRAGRRVGGGEVDIVVV